jgi:NAD-dependent deacetylase
VSELNAVKRQKLVVLSGAGISAESGLRTFRDGDGYWREYRFTELASPQAWKNNREMVLAFYNERRQGVLAAEPNAAHLALVDLEKKYDVVIVTQNVDNLHERAGSSNVIHLHGEIMKSRSTLDHRLVTHMVTILTWAINVNAVASYAHILSGSANPYQ